MDNQVVEGIKGVKLAVHLCRRAGARARGEAEHRGGYDPILSQLGRLKVESHHDGVHRPRCRRHVGLPRAAGARRDRPGLRELPARPNRFGRRDRTSASRRRCKHVAPARITLNPDCGFAPGSAADVSLDEVYTKLKNEVAAAERLREKYG